MYQTFHTFPMLKTLLVLHKLNWLMKNDKQIASNLPKPPTLYRKICSNCLVIGIQNQFLRMSESTFCHRMIFYPMTSFVILTTIISLSKQDSLRGAILQLATMRRNLNTQTEMT